MYSYFRTCISAHGFYQKLIASLFLHGMILCCMACLWSNPPVAMIPAFQAGEFCLDLGPAFLATAPAAGKFLPSPAAEPPAMDIEEKPEKPDDTAKEPQEEPDAIQLASDTPASPPAALSLPNTPGVQAAALSVSGAATPNPGVPDAPQLESYIRPIYPPGARLRGEEGAVTVRAAVSLSGKAQSAELIRSSGFPALDQAAMNAVRRARFVPARNGRLPLESQATLTFRFTLVD